METRGAMIYSSTFECGGVPETNDGTFRVFHVFYTLLHQNICLGLRCSFLLLWVPVVVVDHFFFLADEQNRPGFVLTEDERLKIIRRSNLFQQQ